MSRVFAYCRVSTLEQNTENQRREIEAAGFAVKSQRLIEEHISGSRSDGNVGEENSDFVDVLLSVQKSNDTGFSIDRTAIKGLLLVRISFFFPF